MKYISYKPAKWVVVAYSNTLIRTISEETTRIYTCVVVVSVTLKPPKLMQRTIYAHVSDGYICFGTLNNVMCESGTFY